MSEHETPAVDGVASAKAESACDDRHGLQALVPLLRDNPSATGLDFGLRVMQVVCLPHEQPQKAAP